jgi:hypothetical protein
VSVNDDQFEEILSYNEILDHLQTNVYEEEAEENQIFKFREITAHEGPVSTKDPGYNGRKYNVLVKWETGESTYEPLEIIATVNWQIPNSKLQM